ncbi:hypothetical protein [Leeuwenhoekiella sp. H156]|uniref:hypothetical protein n=1 Tax=Leeuwenhoekiella sp. H156 TaxID=3450128 RepID=UPI003FA45299
MTNEYENTLRRLILNVIGTDDNTDYKVAPERIEKWKEKRTIEEKKNNGVLFENRIIYYSDFYDLKTIIDKNWEKFLPILNDKKRFLVFFNEVEQFRNTVAHGRDLIDSQKNLLKGILSDLKNSITIYYNKNEMKDDYFIKITKINDNLGNIWFVPGHKRQTPTLRVGDEYEIYVEANDPKDREIIYALRNDGGFHIQQKNNMFKFEIPKEFVGETIRLWLFATTPKSEYKNVDRKAIFITVLPRD